MGQRSYGFYLGEISPGPENIINRDFQATAPNEKWLIALTELQISSGKVYASQLLHPSCGSAHKHLLVEGVATTG